MRLMFPQKNLSRLDSLTIFNEDGKTALVVVSKLAFGRKFHIFDATGNRIGIVKEKIFSMRPTFRLYTWSGWRQVAEVRKHLLSIRPSFSLSCNGWTLTGDIMGGDYKIKDGRKVVMTLSKKVVDMTDVYEMDITYPSDVLLCTMIVLAIEAAKLAEEKKKMK